MKFGRTTSAMLSLSSDTLQNLARGRRSSRYFSHSLLWIWSYYMVFTYH